MFKAIDMAKWLLCCLSMLCASVWADGYEKMIEQMDFIKANQVEYQIALEEGKDRSMLCGFCPARRGNS